MSYPRQDSTAKRLQAETLQALDRLQDLQWREIQKCWREARLALRAHIRETYASYFPGTKWNFAQAKMNGAWHTLGFGIHEVVTSFREKSHAAAKAGLNEMYSESILRHSWLLDQVTPPSRQVIVPHRLKLFESSAITVYQGAEAAALWSERWNSWINAYHVSLVNNLQLGMLNASTMEDAAGEVDATRAGSPMYGLMDSLYRLWQSESASAMARAVNDVMDLNGDLASDEIWQARDNDRVCDDCDSQEGLPRSEADFDIPAHPNCNCYWRVVPKSYAQLLRSGDPDDQELAREMDANNLVPSSMVIEDENGNLAGHEIVTFGRWYKENWKVVGQP